VAPFEEGEIGPDLFRAACDMGLEGLVSKRRDRPYQAGRSKHWIKGKNRPHPAMSPGMESFCLIRGPRLMRIFIHGAGRVICGDGISLACALTIPHRSVGPCRREMLRLSRDWPRQDGELKSAGLEAKHLSTLVDVLYRHDGLLHVVATDAAKDQANVARHQAE